MSHALRRPTGRPVVALAVLLVLVAGLLSVRGGSTEVVAYFRSTDGIYPGDEVRVLGVPVGTVTSITPEDGRVRVVLEVDDDVPLPADARAAVVSPSLVSSRYVQLAPRYESGARLEDGDEIPLSRTAVPVEWDEIKGQLNDLSVALGPEGANRDGALSRLVDTAAGTFGGQGEEINATIGDLAAALRTLEQGADDAFATVDHLQVFVTALAAADQQVAEFIERLDGVSEVLADDQRLVRTALDSLSGTVSQVEAFVRDNRGALDDSLHGLADLASVVARQRGDLAQALHTAPNALNNLVGAYHQRQNSMGIALHGANINTPGQLICGAVGGATNSNAQQTYRLCSRLMGDLLDDVANTPQSRELLTALLVLLGQS